MLAPFTTLNVQPGERIADAVYAMLRRAIVRHEIATGAHLSVPALAAQLGTSRSPVHEAIKRLVQEGLATEEPRRGAFVTVYSAPALVPLYEVRCALESMAAALAAERASEDVIQNLKTILDAEADAIARDDMEKHIDIDMQFHQLLLKAAANPTLDEMLGGIYERIHTAMISRVIPTGPDQALDDHRAIWKAIAARDSAAAGRAASAHVMRVCSMLAAQRAAAFLDYGVSDKPLTSGKFQA
ncbi:GntR family transcriptional regulator [Paraburkholderia agricolaris]|uniref:GntR family transcriptional regulator n=1 Tax=Paraburkholderia agricolaris TaxID=2152888 RepID=A0ABW8ZW92_9BURK|nr:GntR family transcriptional regulator [Paraburkholderia agricolaris]